MPFDFLVYTKAQQERCTVQFRILYISMLKQYKQCRDVYIYIYMYIYMVVWSVACWPPPCTGFKACLGSASRGITALAGLAGR